MLNPIHPSQNKEAALLPTKKKASK